MSETKQAETRARFVETKLCEVCSQPVTFDAREVRQQTAKEIAQKLRMYARTCGEQKSAALAYEAAATEIEREYEVSL